MQRGERFRPIKPGKSFRVLPAPARQQLDGQADQAAGGRSWGKSKTSGISDNGEAMQDTVFKTIILKTGPIGLLLIWSLMQNKILMEKLFLILEKDATSKNELAKKFDNLAAEVRLSRNCPLCRFPADGVTQ